MEIKGFGSYTSVEHHLATMTVDEEIEFYLSGGLDIMLDEAERESKKTGLVYKYKTENTTGGTTGEVLQQ